MKGTGFAASCGRQGLALKVDRRRGFMVQAGLPKAAGSVSAALKGLYSIALGSAGAIYSSVVC